ncbi:MAG: bifunctional [glutamate--ammonia ligase]-adenylyl-L-tyrosine phosphorylase/[glutamate--ammonia-ligase] adenylyltransferase, partial [Moraxellaceae bacterium]|nr:bifunctional [glutamate--ammonia ligase]-adenylyl-L-tyrosine phosphorylase/[glutamate--ammonia-ligase] adenylyltransferase [Moraxellaceae bacterium]
RGLLPSATVDELCAAYDFLRRLEHRIQYFEDAQTHNIPSDESDRSMLAAGMGFDTFEAMKVVLDRHRAQVGRHFDDVFSDPNADEHELDAVWQAPPDAEQLSSRLESLGFAQPQACTERLNAFRQGSRYRSLGDDARSRLRALMPRALELCAACPNPDETLQRVLDLVEAICRRAAYLALLQQYPAALGRVVALMSASSWAAKYLTRHPLLLDELLDARLLEQMQDRNVFAAELAARMDALGDDTERQMDVMREMHHAQVFRLLNQDLAGVLTLERVSDHLSDLADVMLAETLRQCWRRIPKRHVEVPRFAIIGYGKLGGKELGYASDLDLVFIYDDDHEDAQPNYARLAQRISTWLSSQTPSGILFETDLRLRPNGDSGLLVSSLEAFKQYQRESAWVWEHQALTRARFCAGDAKAGSAFEGIRHELLTEPRDVAKLRAEVLAMRVKMREAFANKNDGFHVKHDAGGLVDVEFIVQYLVLAHAPTWPELTGNIGNIALLRLAGNIGLIPADTAHEAADAYRALRRAQHLQRLNEQKNVVDEGALLEARNVVIRLWKLVFGE